MTDEPIPSLAEAMAGIRRLRARVVELEAELAVIAGTLAKPWDDGPARYTHNLPPSAPPHDE
jgi:hypothetical protein